jgi:hypothetical protein
MNRVPLDGGYGPLLQLTRLVAAAAAVVVCRQEKMINL